MNVKVLAVGGLLVGCGRLAFDPTGDAITKDATSSGDSAMSSDLVLWLTLDDLVDASGNGHDATCTGSGCPMTIAGIRGDAASFDGVDDCLTVAATAALEPSTGSLAAWLYLDRAPSADTVAIGKPFGTSTQNTVELFANSQLSLLIGGDAAAVSYVIVPAFVGQWNHVVLTWGADTLAAYRDGSLLEMRPFSVVYDGGPLKVGCDLDGGIEGAFWAGAIDDVRLYNRVLEQAEIAALASR